MGKMSPKLLLVRCGMQKSQGRREYEAGQNHMPPTAHPISLREWMLGACQLHSVACIASSIPDIEQTTRHGSRESCVDRPPTRASKIACHNVMVAAGALVRDNITVTKIGDFT